MISVSYINGYTEPLLTEDPYIALENYINSTEKEIDEMIESFNMNLNRLSVESEINESTEDYDLYFESESKNILTKIGSFIVDIFKSIANLAKKLVDNMKNHGFKNKSDLEKINIACKDNPALADKIMKAYNDGDLQLKDIKSVQELSKAYKDLIDASKKASVDPESFKAKYNDFVDKAKKSEESAAVKVAKTAGALIAVPSAILGIKKVYNDILSNQIKINKDAVELVDSLRNNTEYVKNIGVSNSSGAKTNTSSITTDLRNATNIMAGRYNRVIKTSDSWFTRVTKMLGVGKNSDMEKDIINNAYKSHLDNNKKKPNNT